VAAAYGHCDCDASRAFGFSFNVSSILANAPQLSYLALSVYHTLSHCK